MPNPAVVHSCEKLTTILLQDLRLNVELHIQVGVLQKLHIVVSPIKHINDINL